MTPSARAAAAIAVLDRVLAGEPAEKALTSWGRGARYAGSGDRAAVRDLVFHCLRRRRSCAAQGAGLTGRGLVLGAARSTGVEAEWFAGGPHGPVPPGLEEAGRAPDAAEATDMPDWLIPRLRMALGADLDPVLVAMRDRAPVFLRANLARTTPAAARAALAAEGIEAIFHQIEKTVLQVVSGERKIQNSRTYLSGLVELQDASSQAVCAALPVKEGARVLDFCAGAGARSWRWRRVRRSRPLPMMRTHGG